MPIIIIQRIKREQPCTNTHHLLEIQQSLHVGLVALVREGHVLQEQGHEWYDGRVHLRHRQTVSPMVSEIYKTYTIISIISIFFSMHIRNAEKEQDIIWIIFLNNSNVKYVLLTLSDLIKQFSP